MSRTNRNTFLTIRGNRYRAEYAADYNRSHADHYAGKRVERDAMFNGRDNHRGEISGASSRSPKGKDTWDEYWGYDKRGVKRDTAKIIRRRGIDAIRKEVIDFHKDNHNNREND